MLGTGSPVENKVVLFIDILGFAALTEAHELDLERLREMDHPLANLGAKWDAVLGTILKNPKTPISEMIPAHNPLAETFSHFHYALKWALGTASMKFPLTAITFSDSAFIATSFAHEAISLAADLTRGFLASKVPVRIGIAHGSFAVLRFKSDVTTYGGDHAVQFLGTAVVRAHSAETCGIKGMRILLHPSLTPLLSDTRHNPPSSLVQTLPCEESEIHNKAEIRREVNYWDLPVTKEADAWRGLQEMWDSAPSAEAIHYQATAAAINRMRIARGKPGLSDLRRRTLPKVQSSR